MIKYILIFPMVLMVCIGLWPTSCSAADDSVGVATVDECGSSWAVTSGTIVVSAWVTPDMVSLVGDSMLWGGGYGSTVGDSFVAVIYSNSNGEPNTLLDTTGHLVFDGVWNCETNIAALVANASLPQNDSIWIGMYVFYLTNSSARLGREDAAGQGSFYKSGVSSIPTTWPTVDDSWDADYLLTVRVYMHGGATTIKKPQNAHLGVVKL